MRTVPGYLRRVNHSLVLKVPCPVCGVWRSHGAGTTYRPLYEPMATTQRTPHCGGAGHYEWIEVQPEPFEGRWQRRGYSRAVTDVYRESVPALRHLLSQRARAPRKVGAR